MATEGRTRIAAHGGIGLGTFLTLSAALLYIFFSIGNFTIHQIVPRHIRILTITTFDLGSALSRSSSGDPSQAYGSPNQFENVRQPNDGLRLYYTWGLWNRCAGYDGPADPQYCTGTEWAHQFAPAKALLEDLPTRLIPRARSLLIDNHPFRDDEYLEDWSRIAFYFIVVSIVLLGIMLLGTTIFSRSQSGNRAAIFNLIIIGFLSFISCLIASIIWTAIIGNLKYNLNVQNSNLGIRVRYGNAIWILWAINGILLVGFIPYLFACIIGRRKI